MQPSRCAHGSRFVVLCYDLVAVYSTHVCQDYCTDLNRQCRWRNTDKYGPKHQVNPRLTPPGQNGRHFADDIFECIFVNEKVCILIKISLKFVTKGPIDNITTLVQIMAWRRIGDKPLSEPKLTRFTDAYRGDELTDITKRKPRTTKSRTHYMKSTLRT